MFTAGLLFAFIERSKCEHFHFRYHLHNLLKWTDRKFVFYIHTSDETSFTREFKIHVLEITCTAKSISTRRRFTFGISD